MIKAAANIHSLSTIYIAYNPVFFSLNYIWLGLILTNEISYLFACKSHLSPLITGT